MTEGPRQRRPSVGYGSRAAEGMATLAPWRPRHSRPNALGRPGATIRFASTNATPEHHAGRGLFGGDSSTRGGRSRAHSGGPFSLLPPPVSTRRAQPPGEPSLLRWRVVHHPQDAELVGEAAVVVAPDLIGDGRLDLPTGREGVEDPVGLLSAGGVDGDVHVVARNQLLPQRREAVAAIRTSSPMGRAICMILSWSFSGMSTPSIGRSRKRTWDLNSPPNTDR